MVDVVTAEAKLRVAAQEYDCTVKAEQYNAALARHLIESKAPAGHHVDLFGDGAIKPLAECKLTPEPM